MEVIELEITHASYTLLYQIQKPNQNVKNSVGRAADVVAISARISE